MIVIQQYQFEDLIGKSFDCQQIQQLISENNVVERIFTEKGIKYQYYSIQEKGFQFCFTENILESVFLYAQNKHFRQYEGIIPYAIQFQNNGLQIVSRFGEPSKKRGGGPSHICLIYERLGVEIVFRTSMWQDSSACIEYICIFKKMNTEKNCGVCKKQAQYTCSQCNLVSYCGKECQKLHWKMHKLFCIK